MNGWPEPNDCGHSEHAMGEGGLRGRIPPVWPSSDWSRWEPCRPVCPYCLARCTTPANCGAELDTPETETT